jgi:hypothetical protein
MTNHTQDPIIAGPSREQLFDALRLRHEGRTITITIERSFVTVSPPGKGLRGKNAITLNPVVDSISIEDGSGNNWLLKLRSTDSECLEAYFNTATRKGWIRPVSS